MLTVYLFNFMCLLSILVHAEVVLHHAYPEYVITNLYTIEDGYYFNRPLLEEKFRDKEYSTTYKTNSQGFRIADGQDSGRRIERTDWLVLGDSFTLRQNFGRVLTNYSMFNRFNIVWELC